MSFTWQEFADLAGVLASEADEARQRTAINRAYYAAYHAASAYVRAHALCPPHQHMTHARYGGSSGMQATRTARKSDDVATPCANSA